MLKIILFIISALFVILVNGQNHVTCEINFRVENSAYYKQFFVNVARNQNSIIIEYKIREKGNVERKEKDTTTIRVRKDFKKIKNVSPKNDSLLKVIAALDSLSITYATYRIDTLHLVKDSFPNYNNIIDKLFSTRTDSLQSKGEIYLDGTSFTFKLKAGEEVKTVYAYDVNKKNYPQLAEFVAETMALYRRRKHNGFLDKKSTAGY